MTTLYWLLSAAVVAADVLATGHAVLFKRDVRSAIGWVCAIWLAPGFGAAFYLLFGINRIQRVAHRLRRRRRYSPRFVDHTRGKEVSSDDAALPAEAEHLRAFARLGAKVSEDGILPGNRVEPLFNGEQAYPAMLDAIGAARSTISLSIYIFNFDRVGEKFVKALGDAVARGVQVRVILDDIGSRRYAWHTVVGPLRRAGVPTERFLPKLFPRYFAYANLCNHRKILVVDGRIGFTGGINISEGHDHSLRPDHPIQDLHFRIEGPVVATMQEVFAEDWSFCSGEKLDGNEWFPALDPVESSTRIVARGIRSGPDEDLERIRLIYLGALSAARSRVRIMTPYFLPDGALVSALNIAALRGVQVDILLPEESDLRLVRWASTAHLASVLEYGCRVWFTPPPFQHTKLFLVDGVWTCFGSANWDPRSLRLNFEFNVECFDGPLAEMLEAKVERVLADSRRFTLKDFEARPLPVKLRDGVARLLTPYL
jgi:cardiolipin synthase